MDGFITAVYAARLVALGDAARGFVAQSHDDEPAVASLRLTCTAASGAGLADVEWELVDRAGNAIGGGTA